jgi:ABC-type iron transport system FetAB ATPase subunit
MPAYVRLVKGVPYRFLRLVSRFELARLLRHAGFGRPHFALPEPTRAEVAALSGGERGQVRVYRALMRVPVVKALLSFVGPVLQVSSAPRAGVAAPE